MGIYSISKSKRSNTHTKDRYTAKPEKNGLSPSFSNVKKLIYLRTPICTFDAKNGILYSQHESELNSRKKMFRFSIGTEKVISTATNLRGIGFEVEFEVKY